MAPPRGRWLQHRAARPVLFLLCLAPLLWLAGAAAADQLGANPAEALIRRSGDWALRFLCLALAVTPLRQMLGVPALARFRRMLGLYAFFYALVHLACYAWLDQGLDAGAIARDVAKRPFILVGMAAFGLLLLLAAASPQPVARWLGGRRWQQLHRSVYLVAVLAVLHFFWMRAGKRDWAEVQVYAAVLAVLLLARVLHRWRQQRAQK